MGLAAILPLIEAAEVWLFKVLVDDVLVPRDLGALPVLIVAFLLLNVSSGIVNSSPATRYLDLLDRPLEGRRAAR